MADKKISALTAATTPLAGTEVLPIVQSGATVKVSVADLTAGRSTQVDTLQVNGAQSATGEIAVKNPSASGQNKLLGFEGATNTQIIGKITYDQNDDALRITNTSNFAGTSLILGTNDSDDVKIDLSGNLSALTGNLVIGTAGKGIDFSANGGDVLTQYDEGTYTPVFTASSSNPTVTYGLQRGKYVRVGNSVTVSVFITWSAFSGGSGDLQISLPFAGESSVGAGGAGSISDLTGFTFAAGRTFCSIRPNSNVLYATFPQSGSLVSTSNTTVAQTAASGLIVFSTTYLI
jgi:hypothetical protein